MSNDAFTITKTTSWFGRITNAIIAVIFGVILFLGSFLLLTWNEGRAIQREKTLTAGANQVLSISADDILPANEGKLVHISGEAVAKAPVTDPVFGISADALKLRREVEMYQWEESEKSETKLKLGGGEETTTTYSYAQVWSSKVIDSSRFHVPAGHVNPGEMVIQSHTFVAEGIHVGAFQLPQSLVSLIDNFAPRSISVEETNSATALLGVPVKRDLAGGIYIGENPANPQIGDLKIKYHQAASGPVSVIAAQVGSSLEPYSVGKLGQIELLKIGTFSAAVMFEQEQEGNAMFTWILRLVGFLMMLIGLMLVTNVVSVVASVIPFLGSIVGVGVGLLAFAFALPLTLITIALAWLAFRPLIAIPLILVAVALIVFAGFKWFKKRNSSQPGT